MAQSVRRQYRAYAGFVTTPQFFDDAPTQFTFVSEASVEGLDVGVQTAMRGRPSSRRG